MIRKEVEKLRGTVFTPEELEVIIPIVATSKEHANKKKKHCRVTTMLLEVCYNKYGVLSYEYQRGAKLYGTLSDMAKNNPDKLVALWDKVSRTRKLVCPEDIDEELFELFYIGAYFMVYNDAYKVSWETGKDANTVVFERE